MHWQNDAIHTMRLPTILNLKIQGADPKIMNSGPGPKP